MDTYQTINRFATDNIQQATLNLLHYLGIHTGVITQEQIPISSIVEQRSKAIAEICTKINESYLVCSISDQTFNGESEAKDIEKVRNNLDKYDQMLVFAVDLHQEAKINRTEMANLTRALNRSSKSSPVVLVCRYHDNGKVRFAFSLCERTAYKQTGHTGEKAGKVNMLRGINPIKPHTGHVRILESMRLEKRVNTFEAVYTQWLGVFDNDVLTNQFYKELQNWYFWALKPECGVSFPNDIHDDKDDKKYNPQNLIRLITRLIFVWFLRQKGLVPKKLFDAEELQNIVKDFDPNNFESNTYYRVILQNLFFATLNKKIDERAFISDSFVINRNQGKHKIKTYMRHASDLKISKEAFIELMRPVPFMNNSLFECLDNKEQGGRLYNWDGFSDSNQPDRQAFIPNYLFFAKEEYVDLSKEYDRSSASSVKVFGLLNILKRYNFTVEENTPLDQDVALDPELLGKVFENLLAAYNPETEKTVRKSTGSYYTPRPIVQYMVDESLIAYLKKAVPDVSEDTLRTLLSYNDDEQTCLLTEKQTHDIAEALLDCKVLDPACGSGAFPMGMLQQMNHLLSRVDADNKFWEQVVINRAIKDVSFVEKMNNEEKEAHKREIEEVFNLSTEYPDYARKLYLIENCIYGVDIQSIAVQISRLRFFISLLCEQQPDLTKSEKNYNIKPLPNLEMKFVSANTLVRLEHIDETRELFANKEILSLIDELKAIRHESFIVTDQHIKEKLLAKDETLRHKIMLSTGECYVKSSEEKIRAKQKAICDLELELQKAERMSDELITEAVSADLFGEKIEIITYSPKENRIKDIKSRINMVKGDIKRLTESVAPGREKAVHLAKQLTDWNPYDQNVSSPFFDAEWMFGVKNGFDIVIGNPPYVNIENLNETLKKIIFSQYKTCKGRTDIYIAFIEKVINLLNSDGICSFIIPYSYTNQNYATLSREMLVDQYSILEIVDTSKYYIFETAQVKNIIIRFGTEKCKSTVIKKAASSQDFENRNFDTRAIETQKFKLLKNCRLETKDFMPFLSLKKKLDTNTTQLGRICFIAYGVRVNHKTDKNKPKAFYIYNTSAHNLKQFTEGRNIDRYSYTLAGYLKYTPEEHYNPMFPELFENEKIMFINVVSERIRFAYDCDKVYNSHTVINCVRIDKIKNASHASAKKIQKEAIDNCSQYDMKYLLGVLNSTAINWYFHQFLSEGLHFFPDDAKVLPIPAATSIQQQRIIALVEKILYAKRNNPANDSIIEEIMIDKMVYQLYNLTYDEILIIDPATPITREEYEK